MTTSSHRIICYYPTLTVGALHCVTSHQTVSLPVRQVLGPRGRRSLTVDLTLQPFLRPPDPSECYAWSPLPLLHRKLIRKHAANHTLICEETESNTLNQYGSQPRCLRGRRGLRGGRGLHGCRFYRRFLRRCRQLDIPRLQITEDGLRLLPVKQDAGHGGPLVGIFLTAST